jgi:hypothetical protein
MESPKPCIKQEVANAGMESDKNINVIYELWFGAKVHLR